MPLSPRLSVASTLIGALFLTLTASPHGGVARSGASSTRQAATTKVGDQERSEGRAFEPCTEKGNDDKRRDEGHGNDDDGCLPRGSSSGIAKGDFNGDTIADLAIGVPGEDVGGIQNAGAINIIYGSANGLVSLGNQFFTQGDLFSQENEQNDNFGAALAAGDFNGDTKSDLAIGIPRETSFGLSNSGAVFVMYGSDSGLTTSGAQFFIQGFAGLADAAEANDQFGASLSWGDFNGDTEGDLAVGVPFEDVGTKADAGAVQVIYGSSSGLTATGNQFWTQDSVLGGVEVRDVAESGDNFGSTITAGDFNGDTRSDLVVGVPNEDLEFRTSSVVNAGGVNILFGTSSGLTSTFNQFWTQNTVDNNVAVLDTAENFDQFGSSLATGDFNGDTRIDLAIGVPFEDQVYPNAGNIVDAGGVHILYNSNAAGALSAVGNEFMRLPTGTDSGGAKFFTTAFDSGRMNTARPGELFGSSLAAGDFNNDGRKDLAIGEPGNISGAGAVSVAFGGPEGFLSRGEYIFQGLDVQDEEEEGDNFGAALTAWDFNGDGFADLSIGVPGEDLGTTVDAGAVNVLYGRTDSQGLRRDDNGFVAGDQFWSQASSGIIDTSEAGDGFGKALY